MATTESFTRIVLDAFQFYTRHVVSERALREQPLGDVRAYAQLDHVSQNMVLTLTSLIYGETHPTVECVVPKNWWQHFRQTYAPAWWLTRYPVQMTRTIWHPATLWPSVIPPDSGPHANVIIKKTVSTDVEEDCATGYASSIDD